LARSAADFLASSFRIAADNIPSAERALESSVPAATSAVDWANGVNPDNAPNKVAEEFVPLAGKAAGESLKFVLKSGSVALGFAAQNLPAAGEALESATMKVMPAVQSASRGAGDLLKDAAKQVAEGQGTSNEVLRNAPVVAEGAATALNAFADFLPQAGKVVSYGGKAVTPILQAGLGASSQLASDAANMPMPSMGDSEKKQLASALRELGSEASSVSQQIAGKLTAAKP